MKKILGVLLAVTSLSCFASAASVAGNIAESAAMTDCLKTKTQLECNAMQKAGNKAVQAEKNKVEQQQ